MYPHFSCQHLRDIQDSKLSAPQKVHTDASGLQATKARDECTIGNLEVGFQLRLRMT